MLAKGVVRAIVPWQGARTFFAARLRRRLAEEALLKHIAGGWRWWRRRCRCRGRTDLGLRVGRGAAVSCRALAKAASWGCAPPLARFAWLPSSWPRVSSPGMQLLLRPLTHLPPPPPPAAADAGVDRHAALALLRSWYLSAPHPAAGGAGNSEDGNDFSGLSRAPSGGGGNGTLGGMAPPPAGPEQDGDGDGGFGAPSGALTHAEAQGAEAERQWGDDAAFMEWAQVGGGARAEGSGCGAAAAVPLQHLGCAGLPAQRPQGDRAGDDVASPACVAPPYSAHSLQGAGGAARIGMELRLLRTRAAAQLVTELSGTAEGTDGLVAGLREAVRANPSLVLQLRSLVAPHN